MSAAVDTVLSRLEGVKKNGKGYQARCPAHQDHTPSLSVSEGEDGRALVHCHAGCDPEAVLAALHMEPGDLFPKETHQGRQIVATYDYTDEAGALLFQVVRFDPKDFRQRRPAGNDWEWSLGEVRRVPYRLPRVIEEAARSGIVYVAEGEKDVQALEAIGAVATCNPGGAGKWRPEYAEHLRGARVIVVADKDEPGHAHAATVAASLKNAAASVVIVEAAEGKDAADHLAAGHGPEDFRVIDVAAAAPAGPFVDWPAFWQRDRTEPEWAFDDVLARGRGHALYASHKEGKSLFMLWVALQCATSPAALVVVYLDYEMGEDDLWERLEDMGSGPDTDLSRLKYALLPTLPPLDTADGAAALNAMLDAVEAEWPGLHLVVIVDTIGRALSGEENSADTFRAFYAHTGIALKRRGATWARLDHGGKDPTRGQRGSSGKGDDVDVVWKLARTENGISLTRDLARMHWVPERVTFGMQEDPLAYRRLAGDWPAGTNDTAAALDRLCVPLDAATRTAQKALIDAGHKRRMVVISAALKWRREREEVQP